MHFRTYPTLSSQNCPSENTAIIIFFRSSFKREEYLRQSISIAVLSRTLILYLVIGTIFGGKW